MSREEAVEILSDMRAEYNLFGDEEEATRYHVLSWAIQEMKAAQQWIPCKERLPDVGRSVLLSVGKGLYTAEGELKHDGTWVQYRWSANIENVDAWAELPEPWRGEEG